MPYTKHKKGTFASESNTKGMRPGANSWVNNKLRSNFMGFLWCWGWERGKGRKIFNSVNLEKLSLILHLPLDLVQLRVKIRPLCISIPLCFL